MQQQMVLPEGGLASFLTSNLDEMDDSRLAFGSQNGINSMRATAERMAKMGRGGDDVIIHATKNERLIPVEVSAANPELMSQVDIAIADAGADPSAYIVGSETNSINPNTGQREFNFFKKIVRGVKNVFKKLAPIIVPFALNFIAPGLGSIASGFIGAGITGLAQGKSFSESLKMGLQGGIIGGLTSGLRGGFSKVPGSTFGERFAQGIEQTGIPGGDLLRKADGQQSVFEFNPETAKTAIETGDPTFVDKAIKFALPKKGEDLNMFEKYGGTAATVGGLALAAGAFDPIPAAAVPDPYEGPSASERRLANFPRKYSTDIPVAGVGANIDDIMVPYAGEQMAQPTVQIAQPLEEQYPDLYKQYLAQMQPQPQYSAAGGPMESFPRRTGYIAGPGTETSDDIPAMLSDGEFVMNAKAVRGAGNGSREEGVRNMYQMMRAFEGGAVA